MNLTSEKTWGIVPLILLAACGPALAGEGSWTSGGPTVPSGIFAWTSGMARDPFDETIVYAGTSRGVYRSTDNGTSWPRLGLGLPRRSTYSVAPSRTRRDTVFAGSDRGDVSVSVNGGLSWRRLVSLTGVIYSIGVSTAHPGVVAVNAGNTIWRTTDGGGSWARSTQGLPYPSLLASRIAFPPGQPSVAWAATSRGLLRSTDDGLSWTRILHEADGAGYGGLHLSADGQWILTVHSAGFSRSTDGGASWLHTAPCSDAQLFATIAGGTSDSDPVYATGSRPFPPHDQDDRFLCRTTDWGATFEPMAEPPSPPRGLSPSSSSELLVSTSSGLFGMDAVSGWTRRDLDVRSLGSQALVAAPSSSSVAYVLTGGTPGRAFTTTDGGATWGELSSPRTPCYPGGWGIHPSNPLEILVSTCTDLSLSTDGGTTWATLPTGLGMARKLLFDEMNPLELVAATGDKVYRSGSGGSTWSDVTPPLPPGSSLVLARERSGMTYVARAGAVARSSDGGVSWVVTGSAPDPILELVPDPTLAGWLFAVTYSGLFHSTDRGATWSLRSEFPGSSPPTQVVINPWNPDEIHAVFGSRLRRSTNGGLHFGPSGLDSYTTDLVAAAGTLAPPYTLWAATKDGVYALSGELRWGDLDTSGAVDIVDVVLLQAALVGNQLPEAEPWRAGWQTGDVRNDDVLDLFDLLLLQAYIVGNVGSLPGEPGSAPGVTAR